LALSSLSQTSGSRSSALLCSLGSVLPVRQKSKDPLPWCLNPIFPNQTRCSSGLYPWPGLLYLICCRPG